jgi:hypothetical protein
MTNILNIIYHLRLKNPHFLGWIHLPLQKEWGDPGQLVRNSIRMRHTQNHSEKLT